MTSLGAQTAFYYMAIASIASALFAVTRKNPVHSMLWVLALFLHVAGIFLLMGAEFLAAVQVIVYAGAILIFYLFMLMLLDLPDEVAHARFGRHWPLAALVGFSVVGLVWVARVEWIHPVEAALETDAVKPGNVAEIGRALFGPFTLPIEIASLVLLAAVVGAVILARKKAT